MFLTYIVPLSILIPIIIGLLHYKNLNVASKYLLGYLIVSGVINLVAIIFIKYKMNNLPLLHLYTIIEAVFLLSYFRSIFKQIVVKKILLAISFLFPIICIINLIFFQSIFTYNTYTRPLEAIFITFFCLLYLYQSGFAENWLKKSVNWFNIGVLTYFPVVCIIFILSNYMVFVLKDKEMNRMVWTLHGVFVLVMYLVWAKGFSLLKKNG